MALGALFLYFRSSAHFIKYYIERRHKRNYIGRKFSEISERIYTHTTPEFSAAAEIDRSSIGKAERESGHFGAARVI